MTIITDKAKKNIKLNIQKFYNLPQEVKHCKLCVTSNQRPRITFDKNNVCSACNFAEKKHKITDWKKREEELLTLLDKHRSKVGYWDVVVPCSGGKDSYYQTHIITKELGLKPLLMTYHGNNFLPEGDYNRDRMREVFDADHIVWGPNIEVLKKLNLP